MLTRLLSVQVIDTAWRDCTHFHSLHPFFPSMLKYSKGQTCFSSPFLQLDCLLYILHFLLSLRHQLYE